VLAAPVADAGLGELLAVRVAPARVRIEDRVAAANEHLELVEEAVPVRAVRSAVHLEDEWPLLRRVEAARLEEPALDLPSVGADELHALRLHDVAVRDQGTVQVSDLAHLAAELAGD